MVTKMGSPPLPSEGQKSCGAHSALRAFSGRGDPIFVTIFESVFTRPLRAEPSQDWLQKNPRVNMVSKKPLDSSGASPGRAMPLRVFFLGDHICP